jgi:hypothetical protein
MGEIAKTVGGNQGYKTGRRYQRHLMYFKIIYQIKTQAFFWMGETFCEQFLIMMGKNRAKFKQKTCFPVTNLMLRTLSGPVPGSRHVILQKSTNFEKYFVQNFSFWGILSYYLIKGIQRLW